MIDGTFIKRRKGDFDDPFIDYEVAHQVANGKVQLEEIPDKFNKVVVEGDSIQWSEVKELPLGVFQYLVDYTSGLVTFDSSHNGKTLTFKFKGIGVVYFPASRVFVNDIDGNPIYNLKDNLNSMQSQVNTLVVNGDSSPAASQASIDREGNTFDTLKDRIDNEQKKIDDAKIDGNSIAHASLQARLNNKDIEVSNKIGNLSELQTNDKASLVKAVNETTAQLAQNVQKNKVIGASLNEINNVQKGILSITTDDGYDADYRYLLPISQAEGVPFCTAIVTDRVGLVGRNTVEQILELQNVHGWEIMSHTKDHQYLGTLPREQQEIELKESLDTLKSWGLNVENFVYPYSSFNDDTKDLVRKYYRSARSTYGGLYSGINYPPVDTFELKALWMDSNANLPNDPSGFAVNTFNYYKHYIDKAFETNGWIILLLHSNDTEYANLGPLLQQVIQYAKDKLEILTVSQALDKFGNVLDSGNKVDNQPHRKHFAVGYNGKISTNNFDMVWNQDNAFHGDSHIDEFEDLKVTVNRVNTATATNTNMPDKTGGVLYTYKALQSLGTTQAYNYQVFITLFENNIYQRFCNNDKTWGEWVPVNAKTFYRDDFTCQTPITTFRHGTTISNNNTTIATTTGAPESLGGTLITYKVSKTSQGYNWQEYHIYASNKIYRRFFNDAGVASAWFIDNISFSQQNINVGTLAAGETKEFPISNASVTDSTLMTSNPRGDIPLGIVWNCVGKNGSFVLRVSNIKTTSVVVPTLNWVFNITNRLF